MTPNEPLHEILLCQLDRMRSMQYAYHRKFFHLITGSALLLLLLALLPAPEARLAIPFVVITTGVMASFYLHFCDFARIHARALETAINHQIGRAALLGARIEELYFYPLDLPKFSGWSPSAPGRLFSLFTLHWCVLWLALYVWAVWEAFGVFSPPGAILYLFTSLAWGGLQCACLFLYFFRGSDAKAIDRLLHDHLLEPVENP